MKSKKSKFTIQKRAHFILDVVFVSLLLFAIFKQYFYLLRIQFIVFLNQIEEDTTWSFKSFELFIWLSPFLLNLSNLSEVKQSLVSAGKP